jgi:SH3-like domain-containing protein
MLEVLLLLVPSAPAGLAAQDPAPRAAHVKSERVELRAFFDSRSPAVADLAQGAPLRVIEVKLPWARVQVPGGLDLWVHRDFVAWRGADGTITSANVNARPLPQAEPPSAPLGRFEKGEAVVRVGSQGEWFRVRAPERIAAWVPVDALEILAAEPSGWSEAWSRAAVARAAARDEPPPAPAPAPSPAPQPAPVPEPPPAAAEKKDAPAVAAPAAAHRGTRTFPPAQVAKDPARWLHLAQQDLADYRSALVASFDAWSDARAAELESAFTNVLWHGALTADLDGARRGLTGLDALRRSTADWLELEQKRFRAAGDAESAERLAVRARTLTRGWGEDGEGGALLTGWVEMRSGAGPRLPYSIVRNGMLAAAHDATGRWDLSEYAGREIVARGSWRDDPQAPGGRVLALTEVRLLPAMVLP